MQDARGSRSPAGAWAVGDAPTVRGFELAGFRAVVAETREDVGAALSEARAARIPLVVLTEAAAARAPELFDPTGKEGVAPLIAVVPSMAGGALAPSAGSRVRGAVRRALGVPGAGAQ